ncbi:MAG: hypothetical protein ACREJB_06725 [Planctomycetaceae bacterium]
MTTAETAIAKLLRLPPQKQEQVLAYIEEIAPDTESEQPAAPRKLSYGLWKDYGIDLSEEDIAAYRQEMWGNVPREDI